jgi:hypothetical protein
VAHVFITGSSDGLGLMAARLLIEQGHDVVLHGRDEGRSRDALAAARGTRGVVSGDLSTIAGARRVSEEVNKLTVRSEEVNKLTVRISFPPAESRVRTELSHRGRQPIRTPRPIIARRERRSPLFFVPEGRLSERRLGSCRYY